MKKPADTVQAVLFAEVAGSARLHEKLGNSEALWAVDRCVKRMERSVEAAGGRVSRLVGCELMAVFAQLDAAFQAAVEMQQRVADLPPVSGLKLEIRVGFAQGAVTESNGEWVGDVLKLAAFLAGMAEPGEILTDNDSQFALAPALRLMTRDRGAFPARSQYSTLRTCEVFLPQPDERATSNSDRPAQTTQQPGIRLLLHYGEMVVILDDSKTTLRLGRNADNDVVIRGHRVSRHHAIIEKRGNSFVFIDNSTNGSYLTAEGMPEVALRREECALLWKGVISFATPASALDNDYMDYELLR